MVGINGFLDDLYPALEWGGGVAGVLLLVYGGWRAYHCFCGGAGARLQLQAEADEEAAAAGDQQSPDGYYPEDGEDGEGGSSSSSSGVLQWAPPGGDLLQDVKMGQLELGEAAYDDEEVNEEPPPSDHGSAESLVISGPETTSSTATAATGHFSPAISSAGSE